jgi:outer membrane protein TolC
LLLGTRRRAEKARVKQAQFRQEQVRDRIEAEVLAARERVLTAEEQITTAQQAVAQAEETLRVSEQRLKEVGGVLKDSSINVLEVLQAQDALNRARRNFVNALVDYNQAEAELLFAPGEIKDIFKDGLGSRLRF